MKSSEEMYNYLKEKESSARSYANAFDFVIKSGANAKVTDVDGKTYIDCLSGAGTLALGHNNPKIIKVMEDFLESGQILHGLDFSTPIKADFVETLFSVLPSKFAENAKIQFCGPTGSDAVEAAIKLFKTYNGRSSVIAFQGAYHGMAHGSLALTGELKAKNKLTALMPEVHFMPYPYMYRSPFNLSGNDDCKLILNYISNVLNDTNSGITKPASVIIEAIQGEGGCIPAPDEFLVGLRKITEELDIPLIIDEVQTGFGRTGDMFAFEHSGIIPDAIVVSKAIGGGLPLSAVIYNSKYDKWESGAHAGTFRGNQLAMAAGKATLEYIKSENIIMQVREKGQMLLESLNEMKEKYKIIGDVRGRGLMLGIEIVDPKKTVDQYGKYPNSKELTSKIKKICFENGVILESGGRHGSVLRLLPPLTIELSDMKKVIEVIDSVIEKVDRNY
ncbi:diaminobutyrate aminotransferase apoenzyme [Clostridium sp. DSM 8431]|uniref:diaminobutyrate--2-oxoglutarate transaminase family protein n=1 Tax=Clostridium sp. DSM 8431 TaxID=1761781 RepID=UPI0008E4CA7C|nr:diaminobutyrate--2-oxoglutarate transaminase family protein [Clostridium sp. DSM 8431]SFU28911.1 diaminobutyrate aminotransferase apoenzyme [Clostridium sp. DSM 8431]